MTYSRTWQEEIFVPSKEGIGGAMGKRITRSDRQLVEMVLSGNEAAFEEIFDRHKRLVAMIGSRYFRRPEQVEEVVQVVFSKMYFELKNFRCEHELSLPGWLGRITANACLDILRSQKRKPEDLVCELSESEHFNLLSVAQSGASSEQQHIDRDLADKLLARLAPEDSVLLQMLYVEGLSVAEAAKAMGWAISKTKLRAWRARNSMRKTLKRLM
jgi:RNA polymerase sigma-70 factor (ECF subfamily)